MYHSKYLIRVVSYYLPKYAEILEVGEAYKVPAVIEGDIDKDGENEIVALFRRNQKNYILILKLFSKKWYVIWSDRINYKEINTFQLAKLTPQYTQIAIGGKIEREEGHKLSLFNWEGESLHKMLDEPIPFDKLYIEDIDGEDGLDEIALWKHKALEAYDIDLYRYGSEGLVGDKSLEKKYYKMVVSYYEYLNQTDTEGSIYTQYLEQAKRKCGLEYKIEDAIEIMKKCPQDIIVARTAYLVDEEVEEDIYLWGKRQEDFITDMKLVLTKGGKTIYQIIPILADKIYDYQIFVGDFTGNKLDDIWLGTKEDSASKGMHVQIYSLKEIGVEVILDTHALEKNKVWEEEDGEIIEIYPIDKDLNDVYEICYKTLLQKVAWLRWEDDLFVAYNQGVIQS